MPNLKALKNRITSVKSTVKITSAMKMVAAARLRKAQEAVQISRPYLTEMEEIVGNLALSMQGNRSEEETPELLAGRSDEKVALLIIVSSDRGLCGGLNGNIMRMLKIRVDELTAKGVESKFLCIGRKGVQLINSRFGSDKIISHVDSSTKEGVSLELAQEQAKLAVSMFKKGEVDRVEIFTTIFQSALTQTSTNISLIPVDMTADVKGNERPLETEDSYTYEPSTPELLNTLLPKNVEAQVLRSMLESFASEQGARMTAMDNATNNARDLIDRLTLQYNNTRQSIITSELIEIISGAEAV